MSTDSFTATTEELVSLGVPRSKAEAQARRLYPGSFADSDMSAVKRAAVLEKDEQRAIRKMALAVGFKVYWLSQARATKQTPGLPDLWLVHPERGIGAWWETKRLVGGKLSSAQLEFLANCVACETPYGTGDRYVFAQWLREHSIDPPAIPTAA